MRNMLAVSALAVLALATHPAQPPSLSTEGELQAPLTAPADAVQAPRTPEPDGGSMAVRDDDVQAPRGADSVRTA